MSLSSFSAVFIVSSGVRALASRTGKSTKGLRQRGERPCATSGPNDEHLQLLEERHPIANQDRQDRITNFVGSPETKAFAGNYTASNKPDGTERGPQVPIHEPRKIA
jgi:hypothetical protein